MPTPPPRSPGARGGRRALALAAAGAAVLTGCALGPQRAPGATAPPTGPGTAGGAAVPARLPVYWVGGADGRQRLFRELRTPPEGSRAADPIAAAAELMTTARPEDPDYRTLWSPAERVGISTAPDGTISVDMPRRAIRAGLTEEEARLALQQLVHTVADAARTAGLLPERSAPEVVLLVDGRPGEQVLGALDLGSPVAPDQQLEAPVWLLEPQQGARTGGRVNITGRILDGVAGCRWSVRPKDGDTATVSGGDVTSPSRGRRPAEFRAEVDLAPGEYVVTVLGRDAGGEPVRDDKDVVVAD